MLERLGYPLPKLQRSVDWEAFRPELEKMCTSKAIHAREVSHPLIWNDESALQQASISLVYWMKRAAAGYQ